MRIVTLNCEGLGKGWFEERLEVVVEGLKAARPDVLCLQEVTVRHGDDGVYDQAADIAERVGLDHVVFDTYGESDEVRAEHQDGLAIASRWPFTRCRDRRLPRAREDSPDGRVVLMARTLAPDGPLDVVTTHLAWRPEDTKTRVLQARMILGVFTDEGFTREGSRVVFAGDLNATPDEEVVELVSEALQDAWVACHPDDPGHTWTSDNPLTGDYDMPDRRLDYIFCPPGVRVERAEILLDRLDPPASDHFALLAELAYS